MKAWSLVLSKEVSVTKDDDHYVDQDGNLWHDYELACLHSEPDYNQVRIQAAIAAMQGIMSNYSDWDACIVDWYKEEQKHTYPVGIANFAIACADALITELKKQQD